MAFSLADSEYEVSVKSGDHLRKHPEYFGFLLHDKTTMVAHNAHFEYAIWNYIIHKRYGWPALWAPSRWNCTMSRAAACGLPLSLESACKALSLTQQKDVIKGRQAMHKLCKPSGHNIFGEAEYNNDPALLSTLYEYCAQDVRAEMELDKALPELSAEERKVWELDLRINHRGILADTTAAAAAVSQAEAITRRLNAELEKRTGGAVDKATRIAGIRRWLEAKGLKVDSLDKASVAAILKNPTISQEIKDVVIIRSQVGKSSTAKYLSIMDAAGEDKRIRGTLQYHAAATGRWGGRLVQPQNLPKGTMKPDAVEDAIADLKADMFGGYKNPMEALSSCIRGVMCVAPEGKDLVVADYSAIEARVLLWLADDLLALGKYRMGINLYTDMAKFVYGYDVKKDTHPKEYALGKCLVLGAGYGMGKDKFMATCEAWGIEGVDIELAEKAIRAYRDKYKTVVDLWYSTEKAAKGAIMSPGVPHKCAGGRVTYVKKGDWLICLLPSGRVIRYFRPSIKAIDTKWGERQEIHFWAAPDNQTAKADRVIDPKTGLELNKTYGGKLVENITQATARDIMANGMLKAEEKGYTAILTVHDELVAEAAEGVGSVEGFVAALCDIPAWAGECPIAAEGWRGKRYRK
jgi:DNA polymerase